MNKILLVCLASAALSGCATREDIVTVDDASRHVTDTTTVGKFNTHHEIHVDNTKQYQACLAQNSTNMEPSAADAYCRCVTSGGQVVPSQYPQIPPTCIPAGGAVQGYGMYQGYGGMGYGTAMVPGRFPGYPGGAVVIMPDTTPAGVIMTQQSSGGGAYVGSSNSTSRSRDVEDLARATKANHDAICRSNPKDCSCKSSCKGGN